MTLLTVEMVSEAIRKNGVPQVFGAYITGHEENPVGACALGQAYLNLRDKDIQINTPSHVRHFLNGVDFDPENGYMIYRCPYGCDVYNKYLGNMVIHLNDTEQLSYEKIADYIDNRAQYRLGRKWNL